MPIILRSVKGDLLEHAELDNNFAELVSQLQVMTADLEELDDRVVAIEDPPLDFLEAVVMNMRSRYREFSGDQILNSTTAPSRSTIGFVGLTDATWTIQARIGGTPGVTADAIQLTIHNFGEGIITFVPEGVDYHGITLLTPGDSCTVEWMRVGDDLPRIVTRLMFNVLPVDDSFVDTSGSQSLATTKRKWKLIGNISEVPIYNGFEALYVNTSGEERTVAPLSGSCIVVEFGLTAPNFIMANNKAVSVMGDGTDLLVFGDVL